MLVRYLRISGARLNKLRTIRPKVPKVLTRFQKLDSDVVWLCGGLVTLLAQRYGSLATVLVPFVALVLHHADKIAVLWLTPIAVTVRMRRDARRECRAGKNNE